MTIKTKKRIWTTIAIILLFVTYVLWQLYSTVHFNRPGGPFPVGTRGMEFTDSSRWEDALPGQRIHRRLLLQFWYPAEMGVGGNPAAYHPYPSNFVSEVTGLFPDIPKLFLKKLAYAVTNSLENVPISKNEKHYPVIIYSHGMDGMRFMSTYQMEELSSHGYIVVSVEHPFTASGTVFNDGSKGNIIPYEKMENEEYGNAMVDKWTSDHISTLDFLEKMNRDPGNPFFEKMDLGKIGILGYSFGGATATNTLVVDKRIKAGVNLDGFYYGRNFTKGFEQPFMEIRSQPAPADKVTETDLKMSHLSRQRWKWIWFDEWDRRVKAYTRNLKDSYYSYTIEGADHFSFCDIPLMTPFPNLLAPRLSRIHALTNEYTLAFFDQELRGIGSNLLQTRKKILQ